HRMAPVDGRGVTELLAILGARRGNADGAIAGYARPSRPVPVVLEEVRAEARAAAGPRANGVHRLSHAERPWSGDLLGLRSRAVGPAEPGRAVGRRRCHLGDGDRLFRRLAFSLL